MIVGISVQTSPTGPMVQQAGLKISFDLIKRVQVVYVLGLFLVGKHRKKVGIDSDFLLQDFVSGSFLSSNLS